MQTLSGIYDGHEAVVLYEGDDKPVHVFVWLIAQEMVLIDETVPRVKVASAWLASKLGTYQTMHLLWDHGIPETSLLWDLNHTGKPSDEYLRAEFGEPKSLSK
jgi:hypothetical protein